jgi:hypothetical protein
MLIGVITGLVVVLMMRSAWQISAVKLRSVLTLAGQLLAIPGFWFGGSWISGSLLTDAELGSVLPEYLVSLTATFVVIALYPLLRIIVGVGREIGRVKKPRHAQ